MASKSEGRVFHAAPDIFQQPQCIIKTERRVLKLDDEVLQQVMSLPVDKKLVVVAIAGPYRTGKSYLLNRCAGVTRGFALGSTIEAETKGVWIWVRPFPGFNDRYLVLLDTEGLGDVKKGDQTHDAKLFLIANLCSSVLIYNQMNVINEKALDHLAYIAQMSRFIGNKRGGIGDDSTFDIHFPTHFVYVLRDFFLRLEKNKKPITTDEYLEDSLKDNEEASDSSNRVRQCIRKYYARRKCFKFSFPIDQEKMQELDTVKEGDLKETFKEDTKNFLDFIHKSAVPKTNLNGTYLHGQMWGKMLQEIVNLLKAGYIPNIESTMEVIDRAESDRLLQQGVTAYKEEMAKIKLPTPDFSSFLYNHHECIKNAAKYIKQGFLLGNQQMKTLWKLTSECEGVFPQYMKMNEQASERMCYDSLNWLKMDFDEKIRNNHFFKEGGLQEFDNMMSVIQTNYFSSQLGVQQQRIWDMFVLNYLNHKEGIVAAMDEAQKKMEQLRIKEQKEFLQNRIKKEQEELIASVNNEMSKLDEQMRDAGRDFQDTLKKNLSEKLEELEKILQNRLTEVEVLNDTGNIEAAEELKKSMPLLNEIIAEVKKALKEANEDPGCCGWHWSKIKGKVSNVLANVKSKIQ